jgi:hypothetical protein
MNEKNTRKKENQFDLARLRDCLFLDADFFPRLMLSPLGSPSLKQASI